MAFSKAALLLKNERTGQFKPWCVTGFDQTSITKLRFTKNDIPVSTNAFAIGSPSSLNFSNYLSSKDFGTIEKLLIIPLTSGQKLLGIFIIADNPYLDLNTLETEMIFRPIQDILGGLIETHLKLCHVPQNLEPKNISDLPQHIEIKKNMLQQRQTGLIIDFSFKECIAYLLKEFPYLLAEAAYFDIRMRLLNNIKIFFNICYVATGHCYIWIKAEYNHDIDSLISLCSNELSNSLIASDEYAKNIAASMQIIPLDTFLETHLGMAIVS